MTPQQHHRKAERLADRGSPGDAEKVQMYASLAIAGYLEEMIRLLTPAPVASMPDAGDLRSVRAF